MALCLRPGCGRPSWNGKPQEYCSRSCKDRPSSGSAMCARGCPRPSWNGNHGEYCSKTCRDSGVAVPPAVLPLAVLPPALLPPAVVPLAVVPAPPGGTGTVCTQATSEEHAGVMKQFTEKWDQSRGPTPQPRSVWKIRMPRQVFEDYQQMRKNIGTVPCWGSGSNPGNVQRRFHGTKMLCSGQFSGTPCSQGSTGCHACGILSAGFLISRLGTGSGNTGYFGPGHYSTSLPSTAVGYGNVMFLVAVVAGTADIVVNRTTDPLPSGTHSRVANKTTNVDELMVPHDSQMLPLYLMLF